MAKQTELSKLSKAELARMYRLTLPYTARPSSKEVMKSSTKTWLVEQLTKEAADA